MPTSFNPWSPLREWLRTSYMNVIRRTLRTDDARDALTSGLPGQLVSRPPEIDPQQAAGRPYHDLGTAQAPGRTSHRGDVVMISARFRSGSTLLWNIFRRLPGCHAYYEPFNERRWFNPGVRGSRVDVTHREVDVYWKEYEGLEFLDGIFQDDWHLRDFYMSAAAWNPGMKRYVDLLIEHAPGRPVLQFNRLDLRLPWARRNWPNARFIHLYRHPRDQWMSVLVDPASFPKTGRMEDFEAADRFYTGIWARDLKYQFPFLDQRCCEHPYQLHYYLWKLSWLYGQAFAHQSICFEELTTQPERVLAELFTTCDVSLEHIPSILPVIQPPPFGKWKKYADEEWFMRHESHCETVMSEFFRTQEPAPQRAAFSGAACPG